MSFDEMAETFKEVTGDEVQLTYSWMGKAMLWMAKDIRYMFRWFAEVGYGADIEKLRKEHAGLKTFKQWLETESRWAKK